MWAQEQPYNNKYQTEKQQETYITTCKQANFTEACMIMAKMLIISLNGE